VLAYLAYVLIWHNPKGLRHVSLVVVDACSTASKLPLLGKVSGPLGGVEADVEPIVIVCIYPYVVFNLHHVLLVVAA
jgi:hypothetical protein